MSSKKASSETEDSLTSGRSESVQDLAPDGGWGWVVCLAAFVANFILDGTMFSFGVLLIDLLDYFGDSKGKTAWVGSALVGASLILGPIVGLLLDKFSCRQVTITGTLISFVGFVVSIFAPNIEILIITYGIIGGIGFCMVFVTSIIAVGMYFTRKRALATGIAISGAGAGIFTYGYLCDILLSTYGWRGTVLILAGILLNCLICGAVYRPLYSKDNVYKTKTRLIVCKEDTSSLSSGTFSDENGLLILNRMKSKFPFSFGSTPGLNCKIKEKNYLNFNDDFFYDSLNSRKYSSVANLYTANDQVTISYLKPMMRKDIFYSGSITNLRNQNGHNNISSLIVTLTANNGDSDVSSDVSTDSSSSQVQICCSSINSGLLSQRCKRTTYRCLSRRLGMFKNAKFVILLISCTLWTAQSIAMTYMPDMAWSKNIDRSQCALLISIIGISNTVARIVAGCLTDVFHIRSTCIFTSALFIACAVNLALPWCEDFLQLALSSVVIGFCMGSVVALRTIVLADNLGIDQLTNAFGIVAMFQGVAFTVVPPLAGTIFDMTGSYLYPFIMVGAMYFVSGVICVPLLRSDTHLHSNETLDIVISVDDSGSISSEKHNSAADPSIVAGN